MFDHGDILDGLNEQQRRAVTHESGPLLVLAGADPLLRARYPNAAARLADLQRVADAAAAQSSLHDACAVMPWPPATTPPRPRPLRCCRWPVRSAAGWRPRSALSGTSETGARAR